MGANKEQVARIAKMERHLTLATTAATLTPAWENRDGSFDVKIANESGSHTTIFRWRSRRWRFAIGLANLSTIFSPLI